MGEEVLDERGQVLDAFAQGREVDLDDGEAVEEVLANCCCAIICSRSRCVAASTRTSTAGAASPPRRWMLRSWGTRSSLTWVFHGMSPISSRKSVPCWRVRSDPAASSRRR
jgi:hypothetical protein